MSGSSISKDTVFSNFSKAVLEDTGYYETIRSSPYNNIFWGKGGGCTFLNNACINTQFSEFCNVLFQFGCNFESTGISSC